jgi:hypothetical protein
MGDRHTIGQLQNNPTTSGTPSGDGRGTLPRHQCTALFSSEIDRQGCFTSTSHKGTSIKGYSAAFIAEDYNFNLRSHYLFSAKLVPPALSTKQQAHIETQGAG